MSTECTICFDAFNKVSRKQVTCPYCSNSICRTCAKSYIKEECANPRCPNTECRVGWSEDFLSDNLTKTFLLGEYKTCREKVLLDLEKARLPESQEDAAQYKQAIQTIDRLNKELAEITNKCDSDPVYKNAYAKYKECKEKSNNAYNKWLEGNTILYKKKRLMLTTPSSITEEDVNRLRLVYDEAMMKKLYSKQEYKISLAPYRRQKNKIMRSDEYRNAMAVKYSYGRSRQRETATTNSTRPQNYWSFVMKCPRAGCEGFVGKDWKCGLCTCLICSECREQIESVGAAGSGAPDDVKIAETTARESHCCNPEVLANVKALVKEAKPCPKCAAVISKIDGCDQMWCTQCQTAFSWRTGQIEIRVHNPHYYEWLRRTGGAVAPTPTANQINGECLAQQEVVQQVIYHNRTGPHSRNILNACRFIQHIESELLYIRRGTQTNVENEEKKRVLRVKRLLNEITDDEWKDRLQRMDKAIQKDRRVAQVLELFVQAGTDLLRGALPADADKAAIFTQIDELRAYCDDELKKIESRYNNIVPDMSACQMNDRSNYYGGYYMPQPITL